MKTLLYFYLVQPKYEVIHVLVWLQDVLAACAGPHSFPQAEWKGVGMIWVLLFSAFMWQLEVRLERVVKYLRQLSTGKLIFVLLASSVIHCRKGNFQLKYCEAISGVAHSDILC